MGHNQDMNEFASPRKKFEQERCPLTGVGYPQFNVIKEFEASMKDVVHKKCHKCKSIGLKLKGTFNAAKTVFTCNDCKRWRKPYHWKEHFLEYLPVWYNDDEQAQFHVPECLKDLREGEKLLIQQISPYVPLEHLKQGAHACVGHVCSFPQDIDFVCKELPRKSVNAIRISKHFKLKDGTIDSTTFRIRKDMVLKALHWLKKYNACYHNITCLLYTSPSPRDRTRSRMPSSA